MVFQHLLDRKEESILRFPVIGRLLHFLYLIMYGVRNKELIFEVNSTELMHQVEKWMDTQLDDFAKDEVKRSYDRYFEGVPEEQRGIWIRM